MVANQPTLWTTLSGSHARAARTASAAKAARRLPTAHLVRTGAAQQRFDAGSLVRSRRDEDAELVVGEPRIVLNRPEAARREQRVEQNPEDRGQRSEQDRHLEHDDDVRRNREDRLAADHERPVARHPQRQPRADAAAGDAADQGEHAHRTDGLAEGILDLVARDGRVHREVGVARGAQLLDGVQYGIEIREYAKHTGGRGRVEQLAHRLGQRQPDRATHRDRTCPRLGGASTSFTSLIETAGKFFTNSRNHMKNQPKLPAMMPQSAHVGLYTAFAQGLYGSPASDTTMIT